MARKHEHEDRIRVSEVREHLRKAHGYQVPMIAGMTDPELSGLHTIVHNREK